MLCLALRLWSGQNPSQPENNPNKISVTVNAVLVPVAVRNAQGKAAGNLKKEDFQVFDKNKPQAIVGFDVLRPSTSWLFATLSVLQDHKCLSRRNPETE